MAVEVDQPIKLAVLASPDCQIACQLCACGLFDARVWLLDEPRAHANQSIVERFYRFVDRRLFGVREPPTQHAPQEAFDFSELRNWRPDYIACLVEASATAALKELAPVLFLRVGGLASCDLDLAVRSQVGQPNGVVQLDWQDSVADPTLRGFGAACAIDHRSVQRSIELVWSKCPAVLLGLIRRMEHGGGWFTPSTPPATVARAAVGLLLALVRHAARWLVLRDQWWIRVYESDCATADEQADSDAVRASIQLRPDSGAFWADPFLYRHADGRWMVFYEALPYATGRGHIAVIDLADKPPRPAPVLLEPWHLSYPFVFDWEGSLYMVPESSANRSVDLYLCDRFPTGWRKVKTLINGPRLADATLFFREGRWWMLAAHGQPGASMYDELHVYWSDDLLGHWQGHALNPVRIDARNTRPAGAVFEFEGRLIRPVQDCSATYGGALRFNEIVRLDVAVFEERDAQLPSLCVPGLEPGVPVHTYNALAGRVCVDSLHAVLKRPWRAAGTGYGRQRSVVG